MRVGSKIGAKFANFLASCKNREELVEMSAGMFLLRHLGSKRRYTFYPAWIGRLATWKAGDEKEEDLEVKKYIASGNLVTGG